MIIFELDKENILLSIAEVIRLVKPKKTNLIDSYLIIENKKIKTIKKLDFARVKEVNKVITYDNNIKEFKQKIQSTKLKKIIKQEYKIETNKIKKEKKELINLIWMQTNTKVNIKKPKQIIKILKIKNNYFLCEKIWKKEDKILTRHNKNLPEKMPTTLNPKLAKTMINLTGLKKGKILDPFCGAGGILIEAARLNFKTKGQDIDKRAIGKAKLNLLHLGYDNVKLERKDALEMKGKYSAIVTDLPYGKNSKINKELKQLYKEFFNVAAKHTKLLVVGLEAKIDIDKALKEWKIINFFEIYIHKNLSKKIYILEKSKK
jgi:tRNA (guanine10-N2)-dimethyltransferase